MKFYEKEYEDYYTSEIERNKCKLHLVNNTAGYELDEYIGHLRDTVAENQAMIFEHWIKFEWLRSRFVYNGQRYYDLPSNSYRQLGKAVNFKQSFYALCRQHLSEDPRIIMEDICFRTIRHYLKDFFPGFYTRNPFKEEMKYPYQYMSFGSLRLVQSMLERIELLEYGEKNKMSYAQFVDFIINYIKCYNDEVGYLRYDIYWHAKRLPMVHRINKHEDKTII